MPLTSLPMSRRREFLLLPCLLSPLARAADVAGWHRDAFEAQKLANVLKVLGLGMPQPSDAVTLKLPELSEDGSVVPVSLGCALPGVQRLLLCLEKNPSTLAAVFEPGPQVEAKFTTRVKMQETSPVHALAVLADGRVLSATREVRVTLSGCTGAGDFEVERPDRPSVIRVQASGGGAMVRALMKHPMENGRRKDEAGRVIPAWHIQQVVASLNDQAVLHAYWGPSISRNPFLQFSLKEARLGDRVALTWTDNQGLSRSDEVVVA